MAAPISNPALALPLVVGVSTRAMFDLSQEHEVYERDGLEAYIALQRARETTPLAPGPAFEAIRRLLALNKANHPPIVDVILLSRNSPDLSLRAFNSCRHHDLAISRGSFSSGRSVAPLVQAWKIDLFLSNDHDDVRSALAGGAAAARFGPTPPPLVSDPMNEVRFAFDGDAVVFSPESDRIFREQGLDAFTAHEAALAQTPLNRGPFGHTFLPKLAEIRRQFMGQDGVSRVRISIVTARKAPAHERVIHTLRAWGTPADEAHFVGSHTKADILRATGAHIFFDDQEGHIAGAQHVVASGLVPA